MFQALSEIIEAIIVYPLGLTITLLTISLIILVRSSRQLIRRVAIACIVFSIVWLWACSSNALSSLLVRSLEFQNLPAGDLPPAQAIVVLGGGIKSQIPPRPWVEVAEEGDRILYGARLFVQGKAPLLITSGGRDDWGMSEEKPESEDMASIAKAMGVPAQAIAQDPNSLNTYENAVNVKAILEKRQINRILLVTSAMHMPRSLAIFRKLGIEAIAAPTDFVTVNSSSNKSLLENLFELLPNVDALRNTTKAIKEYIGLWVYRFRGWA